MLRIGGLRGANNDALKRILHLAGAHAEVEAIKRQEMGLPPEITPEVKQQQELNNILRFQASQNPLMAMQMQGAPGMGNYPSPVMMEHLFALMNANQPRYVPVKKGPSISDRVMNSFDPAFFSPEFIPPEEQ